MYTILQDSSNKIQIPYKGLFTYLLIVFTYRHKSVTGIFEALSGEGCDYDINIVEVGSEGTVDVNNGQIKLSPRGTWKAKIYGQNDNINLSHLSATFLYDYNFQVKGESCKVYPTDLDVCPSATAVVKNTEGTELSSTQIASGASQDVVAPDSTAVVKDQNGTVLATENIPSGVSEDIVVNTGGSGVQPLYAYNYPALNTGQDVSYAVGDDKWVRDNVFNPEVATWPTDRPWVFPVLDPNNPLMLLRGATPEGNNIFGNLNRFTDTLGTQVYANGLVIDHYSGMCINKTYITTLLSTWIDCINLANNIVVNGVSGFHLPNVREYESLMQRHASASMGYAPFNYSTSPSTSTSATTDTPFTSTSKFDGSAAYCFVNKFRAVTDINDTSFIQSRGKNSSKVLGFVFKKAFTYDNLVDTEKLIISL